MAAQEGFYWSYKCRDCFHCKQKRFNTIEEFSHWLRKIYCDPRATWDENFVKKGSITMYWCNEERITKPKSNPPGVGACVKKGAFCHYIDI